MSKLFGIDTSRWQEDFDFKGAKDNEGVDFAIIKAGVLMMAYTKIESLKTVTISWKVQESTKEPISSVTH